MKNYDFDWLINEFLVYCSLSHIHILISFCFLNCFKNFLDVCCLKT